MVFLNQKFELLGGGVLIPTPAWTMGIHAYMGHNDNALHKCTAVWLDFKEHII